MKRQGFILALVLVAGASLGACTKQFLSDEVADRIASPAWMAERNITAGSFSLKAFERMHKRYAPADIYIEGDGKAWVAKNEASSDPTPLNPVALHLAS